MTNYLRTPMPLRALNQWVNWRYEETDHRAKWTKIPFVPCTETHANVVDPATWRSFSDAVEHVDKYNGIGFVLTANDPFFVIDLDITDNPEWMAVQTKVREGFQTYQEISPSGRGLHILGMGSVAAGRRRAAIEVYSSARYITVTGDVFLDLPLTDCQFKLNILWAELSKNNENIVAAADQPQRYSDQEVLDKSSKAYGALKFHDLFYGKWEPYYPSQSEADYAFIDMIAFFSRNKEQIERIFMGTQLGQRKKAQRKDYVGRMIYMAFDNFSTPLDFEAYQAKANAAYIELKQEQTVMPEQANGHNYEPIDQSELTLPPGLLGNLAKYFYESSYRPMKEAALVAALGVMAGLCGRAYNTSTAAGLNLYLMFVARTGMGKDEMSKAIGRLQDILVTPTMAPGSICIPAFMEFFGPGEISSNTALVKRLQDRRSFVSLVGEFGLMLSQISDQRATQPQKSLLRAFLHVYNKSGKGSALDPMVFADEGKNTLLIKSPSFSIIGEGTPESFYEKIDERLIAAGLIPRFIIIEYSGNRPIPNEAGLGLPIPSQVLADIAQLTTISLGLNERNEVIPVGLTADAKELENKFNYECDHILNSAKGVRAEIWNRAHLNTLKIACLVAIGINPHNPIVTAEVWNWAASLVGRSVHALQKRFESGEIGQSVHTSDNAMASEVLHRVNDWLRFPFEKFRGRYKTKPAQLELVERMHNDKIVPYLYLQNTLSSRAPFSLDRMGGTAALKRTLQTLVDCGELIQIPTQEIGMRYGGRLVAYRIRLPGETL